jgi:hypothetical protein
MKKTMIFALAVLGMVIGSIAIVQPVHAQGGSCGPAYQDGDCVTRECGDCLYVDCGEQGSYIRCFPPGEQ